MNKSRRKLSREECRAIVQHHEANHETQQDLADKWGLHRSTIRKSCQEYNLKWRVPPRAGRSCSLINSREAFIQSLAIYRTVNKIAVEAGLRYSTVKLWAKHWKLLPLVKQTKGQPSYTDSVFWKGGFYQSGNSTFVNVELIGYPNPKTQHMAAHLAMLDMYLVGVKFNRDEYQCYLLEPYSYRPSDILLLDRSQIQYCRNLIDHLTLQGREIYITQLKKQSNANISLVRAENGLSTDIDWKQANKVYDEWKALENSNV